MKEQIAVVTAVLAGIFLSQACGNDDDTGSNGGGTGGSTDAGSGGAGGSTGTGGSTSGGGAGGSAGSAGSATGGGGAGGGAGAGGSAGSAGGATGGGAGVGGSAGGAPVTCDNPAFTTSDTNGGWSNGGYYVHNNVWNASEAGPETLYACSYKNWYVTSTQPDTTSVKAYPNVHLDINNLNGLPLSSYSTIFSTFASSTPHVGIYNVAYDIWLNGVGWGGGTTEVMIWTENYNQVPLGSSLYPRTFGGKTYDVYRYTSTSSGGVQVISFLSTDVQTSGTVDLKAMLEWIVSQGWISANATINQIGYGVEICSTDNQPATFYFTDFSVTMS